MIRLSPSGVREAVDRIPTTDLYFLNPLSELTREGADIPKPRFLVQNVYVVGDTGVIVRYGGTRDLARLGRAGAKRIVYIADDDFAAGGSDPALPERYRLRLRKFAEGDWRRVTDAADIVIVPGAVLAEVYGAKARIIPPAWEGSPASTEHFDDPTTIEIVHLGTGSHRGDLSLLAAPLARLLERHPRTRLTLLAGETAPGALRSYRHVRLKRPHSWWRYKRAIRRMRYHLAVYPLAPTPFNHARSANKLFEHAMVGAASLMSPNPALRAAAGQEAAATFVEGDAEDWEAKIAALLAEPEAMRLRVEKTRAHLHATNPLAHAALQWRDILAAEL